MRLPGRRRKSSPEPAPEEAFDPAWDGGEEWDESDRQGEGIEYGERDDSGEWEDSEEWGETEGGVDEAEDAAAFEEDEYGGDPDYEDEAGDGPDYEDESEDGQDDDSGKGTSRREKVASSLAELKAGLAPLVTQAAVVGRGLRQAPRQLWRGRRRLDFARVLVVAGIAAAALVAGAAGYLVGRGSGGDLDLARERGELSGKRAGALAGAKRGYAAGFTRGRESVFRKAYATSYRRNYRRAYLEAGLTPPPAREIEVPRP